MNKETIEATLYTTFKRLEQKNLIEANWVESNENRNRKYYAITSEGKRHLFKLKSSWDKAKMHLERIVSPKDIND